jgi:hypothetical protein
MSSLFCRAIHVAGRTLLLLFELFQVLVRMYL